jgi:hypothetical protein
MRAGNVSHIVEKISTKVNFFPWISLQLEVYTRSYGLPKCRESQFWEFWDSQVGSPATKWHLDVAPMVNHREYHKGGRWWLPPSPSHDESCESMYAHGSSVHQKCSNHALTKLLFGLCKPVWIIDPLVAHPSPHPGTPARPFTPKLLRTKKRTFNSFRLTFSIVFIFELTFQSFKECKGASCSKLD